MFFRDAISTNHHASTRPFLPFFSEFRPHHLLDRGIVDGRASLSHVLLCLVSVVLHLFLLMRLPFAGGLAPQHLGASLVALLALLRCIFFAAGRAGDSPAVVLGRVLDVSLMLSKS